MELPKETFGKNLRSLRKRLGLSQEALGEAVGLTKSQISRYENGQSEPPIDLVVRIGHVLGVDPLDLFLSKPLQNGLGGVYLGIPDTSPVKTIPILGRIHAGTPWEAEPVVDGEMPIPADMPAQFALRVHGDSMEPDIREGDWVVCQTLDHGGRPAEGRLVVALLNGSEATVKQLIRRNGGWALHAANPAYPDVPIDDPADTRIQAVVVGVLFDPARGAPPRGSHTVPVMPATRVSRRQTVDISDLDPADQARVQDFIAALRLAKRQRSRDDLPDDLPF